MSALSIVHPWFGLARPLAYFRQLLAAFGAARCRLMHRAISRPVSGHYHCWVCLREFRAEW